jgi:hypothetical protein
MCELSEPFENSRGRRRSLSVFLLAVLLGGIAPAPAAQTPQWAFQPLQSVEPPIDSSGWAANEIDRFILARLREQDLKPNPPADKRVLLRRAYFDLIGLPPTPRQVDAFLADRSPDAFAKVVDELLASKHYGERWGRHWLDLARYADTSGDGADAPVPEAWLYRDYVIDAFNADLPYDQLIIEQIAGDLLAKTDPATRARERLIATSYVGLTRRFNNGEYRDMHLVIENTLSTIGKGMLGMSIGCARCHDHKYDPISQQDYYSLYGYFESTQYPHAGTESGRQRKNFTPLPGGGLAYAVFDKQDPKQIQDTRVHQDGNPSSLGAVAKRGYLDILDPADAEIAEGESGRLQLARWIASPDNPLTTRVMANRIWQYHFGRGLVKTSSTFGKQGDQPTHPQLLDWLATRFVQDGWSFKKMHQRILLSRTWQQSSDVSDLSADHDPDNKLLSHFPRRRLDAEPIRDAILFVGDRLKLGSPGPHPFPKPNAKDEYNYTQHNPFSKDYENEYRTVYLPSRRLGKHPYLETFNGPDPNECTANRTVSTVPLQALFWMNSDFLETNAKSFAARLAGHSPDPAQRVKLGYEIAYSRPPSPDETRSLTDYVAAQAGRIPAEVSPRERETRAWTSLCRILLSANEFIYID